MEECPNCFVENEEEVTGYQALEILHILDNVLGFLDLKTLKSARRVCKQWNNEVLSKFRNRLSLFIPPTRGGEGQPEKEWSEDDDDSGTSEDEGSESRDGQKALHHWPESEPSPPTTAATRLANVDVRLLTNLRVCESWREPFESSKSNSIKQTIEFLTSKDHCSKVKKLDLQWAELHQLNDFVNSLKSGLFVNLEHLFITGFQVGVGANWRIPPGVLPSLKTMTLWTINEPGNRKNTSKLNKQEVFYQSLVYGAPNLISLETAVAFPLNGMEKLTKVSVRSEYSGDDDDGDFFSYETELHWKPVFVMLKSLKDNLTSLDLTRLDFLATIPVFPNVKNLAIDFGVILLGKDRNMEADEKTVHGFLSSFPSLTKLIVNLFAVVQMWPIHIFYWAGARKLEEFQILDIVIPNPRSKKGRAEFDRNKRKETRDFLSAVVNMTAPIPLVVLSFSDGFHISELIRILCYLNVNEKNEVKNGEFTRTLEFHSRKDYFHGWKQNKRMTKFPDVINNLMKNWSRINFKHFWVEKFEADTLISKVENGSSEIYYRPNYSNGKELWGATKGK